VDVSKKKDQREEMKRTAIITGILFVIGSVLGRILIDLPESIRKEAFCMMSSKLTTTIGRSARYSDSVLVPMFFTFLKYLSTLWHTAFKYLKISVAETFKKFNTVIQKMAHYIKKPENSFSQLDDQSLFFSLCRRPGET